MTLNDGIRKGQSLKWGRELLAFFFFLAFLGLTEKTGKLPLRKCIVFFKKTRYLTLGHLHIRNMHSVLTQLM